MESVYDYSCKDCNVIVISIDALRADHLGVYGYPRNTSPTIDELSKNAFVFNNAFSNGAETFTSIGSEFTSLYPCSKSLPLQDYRIYENISSTIKENDQITLAEVLKKNGYATGLFTANDLISPTFGFDKGFDKFSYMSAVGKFYPENYKPEMEESLHRDIVDFVSENMNRKFFVFIHYIDVHAPYTPPEPFFSMFGANDTSRIDVRYKSEAELSRANPDKEAYQTIRNAYDGSIMYVDYKISFLMRKIGNLGIMNKTIVIITADHGEELGERGGIGHGVKVNKEIIRIPFIIQIPGTKGGVVNKTVELVDLAPTILDLLEIPKPLQFQGQNLFTSMKQYAFSQRPPFFSIINGNLQFILNTESGHEQVFNLTSDPYGIAENEIFGDTGNLERIVRNMVRYNENCNTRFSARVSNDSFSDYSGVLVGSINTSTIKSISDNGDLVFDVSSKSLSFFSNPIILDEINQTSKNKFFGRGIYIDELGDGAEKTKGVILLYPITIDKPRKMHRIFSLNKSYYAIVIEAANIADFLNSSCYCSDSMLEVNIIEVGTGVSNIIFKTVLNSEEKWKKYILDISSYSGKEIQISLQGHPGGPCGFWCAEFTSVDKFYLVELTEKPLTIKGSLVRGLKQLGYVD